MFFFGVPDAVQPAPHQRVMVGSEVYIVNMITRSMTNEYLQRPLFLPLRTSELVGLSEVPCNHVTVAPSLLYCNRASPSRPDRLYA